MAKHSLDHCLSSLNLSVTSYEILNQSLNQAQALVHVALQDGFACCENFIIHDYLCVLDDLILKAKHALERPQDALEGTKV